MDNAIERPKRSRSGCLWAVIALQGVVLLLVVLGFVGASALRRSMAHLVVRSGEMGADDFPALDEVWSCGRGDVKVVRVPLKGVIMLGEDGGLFSSAAGTADLALAAIRRATNDPEVKGIILDVDSGGGGITASEILYDALLEFKSSNDKRKVVALFGDVAASGAYYVAAAADRIVAHPTTLTGSIGVLMQTYNVHVLAQKVGVTDVTIKSGANKDLLNPFEPLNTEQRQMLQDVIDALHSHFVNIVSENRNLPEDKVRAFADGRVFIADKAKDLGLVDEIGHWQTAVDSVAELLGTDDVKVYRYEHTFTLKDLLTAKSPVDGISALLRQPRSSRPMYLWQP